MEIPIKHLISGSYVELQYVVIQEQGTQDNQTAHNGLGKHQVVTCL